MTSGILGYHPLMDLKYVENQEDWLDVKQIPSHLVVGFYRTKMVSTTNSFHSYCQPHPTNLAFRHSWVSWPLASLLGAEIDEVSMNSTLQGP